MVPRTQASNLRALTYSGLSREYAKYISLSLSLSLFCFCFCLFVCLFLKKVQLQHIVVFNLYKKQLFVISGKQKKKTRHLRNFPALLGGVIRHSFYLISQGRTPRL